MPHTTLKMLAITAALSVAGAAHSATFYEAILSGANENPPVVSPGSGTGSLKIDGNLMTIDIVFQDLIGNTTASHVHCCAAPPANAGVATPVPTFPGFPLGVTSGNYSQTFDMTLATSYNPAFITNNGGTTASAFAAFVAGLNSGKAYLNVHSSFAPGGEIRGTFALVPEPQTWALMITGFGLVGTAIRRRRQAALPA